MRIRLPITNDQHYDWRVQEQLFNTLEKAFALARSTEEHLEVVPPTLLILRSPNGARWKIEVSNAGTIAATAL